MMPENTSTYVKLEQHMAEMAASGIPCRRFDLNESGLMMAGKDAVRVIEGGVVDFHGT